MGNQKEDVQTVGVSGIWPNGSSWDAYDRPRDPAAMCGFGLN